MSETDRNRQEEELKKELAEKRKLLEEIKNAQKSRKKPAAGRAKPAGKEAAPKQAPKKPAAKAGQKAKPAGKKPAGAESGPKGAKPAGKEAAPKQAPKKPAAKAGQKAKPEAGPAEDEKTPEERMEEEMTDEEIEKFEIEKTDMDKLINRISDILAGFEGEGMLQNDLWKKLKLNSRDGSRLSLRLERAGIIGREKILENGRWTYRLIVRKTPVSTRSIEEAPCLTCPVEQKCTVDGEISPQTCDLIEAWVLAGTKRPKKAA